MGDMNGWVGFIGVKGTVDMGSEVKPTLVQVHQRV